MVNLLEEDFVAIDAFPEVAAEGIFPCEPFRERFPDKGFHAAGDTEEGFTSGDVGRLGDLVVGIIGKEGVFRVFTACRQSAVARNEHPEIRIADDAHEEGADGIVVCNPEIAFLFENHFLQFRRCSTAWGVFRDEILHNNNIKRDKG